MKASSVTITIHTFTLDTTTGFFLLIFKNMFHQQERIAKEAIFWDTETQNWKIKLKYQVKHYDLIFPVNNSKVFNLKNNTVLISREYGINLRKE